MKKILISKTEIEKEKKKKKEKEKEERAKKQKLKEIENKIFEIYILNSMKEP